MSKKDQAARIAERWYNTPETRKAMSEMIRRAIDSAVRKERERCVACVDDCKMVGSYAMISIIKAITGNKRKGKR